MTLPGTLALAAYVPVAFLLMFVAKLVFDVALGSADHAIGEESNLARGMRRGGIYLSVTLGLYGVMSTPSTGGLLPDLATTLLDGLVLIVLIVVAGMVNDRVILRGIDNREALARGNVAVGLVELASYVATGFIALSAFAGQGGGVLSAVVFFFLGQAALVLIVALYEAVTPFKPLEQIRDGNTAAGLMVGGMLIALSIVLSASVAGDFTGWTADLLSFGVSAAVGILALLIVLKPIDWVFLPNTDFETEIVRDRNVAAISVATAVQIAIALVVTSVFL